MSSTPKHHEALVNAANAAASAGTAAVGAEAGINWLFWGGLIVLGLQGVYWVLRIVREHRALSAGTPPTGPGKL